jgi:hypothetical protein
VPRNKPPKNHVKTRQYRPFCLSAKLHRLSKWHFIFQKHPFGGFLNEYMLNGLHSKTDHSQHHLDIKTSVELLVN